MVGRVVFIPDDDIVGGGQIQTVADDVVGFTGVTHQSNLIRADIQLRGDQRARVFQQTRELAAIVKGAILINICRQKRHLFSDCPERGAQIGSIHRHGGIWKRKLLTHHLPVIFTGHGLTELLCYRRLCCYGLLRSRQP